MRQVLVASATAAVVAVLTGGGYVIGHDSASDCPKGYTRGVTASGAGGPGTTLPQNAGPWQYQMISVCYRTVTLPHVRLVGGPYGSDNYFEMVGSDGIPVFYVALPDGAQQNMASTRAEDAPAVITFENNKTRIAIRTKLSEGTLGPATHYRLSDGVFLGTDNTP
jgi:hypothetical protein